MTSLSAWTVVLIWLAVVLSTNSLTHYDLQKRPAFVPTRRQYADRAIGSVSGDLLYPRQNVLVKVKEAEDLHEFSFGASKFEDLGEFRSRRSRESAHRRPSSSAPLANAEYDCFEHSNVD